MLEFLQGRWICVRLNARCFNRIIRLCISTGQRRGELAQLKPEYVDGVLCTLPGEITKNHQTHTFPLNHYAIAHLHFSDTPFNNWGDAKTKLDKECGVKNWTIHDLRRAFRSRISKFAPPHICERLVNHVSHRTAMERVYDMNQYLPELRAAMKNWENELKTIVG